MNEAEYIRLLISQKPNDYPEVRKLLKELINEINRIGININQIVFNSNAQLYSKKDKEQLVAYMAGKPRLTRMVVLCQIMSNQRQLMYLMICIEMTVKENQPKNLSYRMKKNGQLLTIRKSTTSITISGSWKKAVPRPDTSGTWTQSAGFEVSIGGRE